MSFDYSLAMSRNIGVVSTVEQEKLRNTTVAIPGCGGVGGIHALCLARLGIAGFKIADFDHFEVQNFNRQFGAKISTLGQNKVEVISKEIHEINPEATVTGIQGAINAQNIDTFLAGVDVVVDSLDFFAFEARELLFRKAAEQQIPVVTAGPLGMSTAVLIFTKAGMQFTDYFDLKPADSKELRAAKFALGLAPARLHTVYMDAKYIDFKRQTGPSSVAGVTLCGGIAAVEVARLVLWPETVKPAPFYLQFDARLRRFSSGKIWFGNRNPLQKIRLWLFQKFFLNRQNQA